MFIECSDLKRHMKKHRKIKILNKQSKVTDPHVEDAAMNLMVLTEPVLFSSSHIDSPLEFHKQNSESENIEQNNNLNNDDISSSNVAIADGSAGVDDLESDEVIAASHLIDSNNLMPSASRNVTEAFARSSVFNSDDVSDGAMPDETSRVNMSHSINGEENVHLNLSGQSIVSVSICDEVSSSTSDQSNVVMLAPVNPPEDYLGINSCSSDRDVLEEIKESIVQSNLESQQSERVLSQAKW